MSAVSPLRAEPAAAAPDVPAAQVAVLATASQSTLASRILQLQACVLTQESFAAAAAAFATELAAMLDFDRAAIGFCEDGRTRVVATSQTADFEPNAALFSAFAAAMDEALEQNATVTFPAGRARPLITLSHAALARQYGGVACTVPLVTRGRAFGALTLVRGEASPLRHEQVELCEHVACIVGPILELKHDAERPWRERLRKTLAAASRKVTEPGNARVKLGTAIAAGIVAALLFVPVQYRVGAQARVEGAVQRALVAPADGFLRHVHVRPGDRVTSDQVLAELAEDDLKLEQRKWQSELTQHENAASAALARSDRAQYVINQSKADEARAQLDLAERQLARTRVIAPFDGVVIKGDLSQSMGAPVRRGDVLLTVAPSDRFRLLIEVDERDIAHVVPGRSGVVALGAFTDRSLPFRVARVTPVSAARDGRNFFEVEGELETASSTLRPGLQGVAKIEAGSRPLAWIWTHRLLDWLRLTLWSAGW